MPLMYVQMNLYMGKLIKLNLCYNQAFLCKFICEFLLHWRGEEIWDRLKIMEYIQLISNCDGLVSILAKWMRHGIEFWFDVRIYNQSSSNSIISQYQSMILLLSRVNMCTLGTCYLFFRLFLKYTASVFGIHLSWFELSAAYANKTNNRIKQNIVCAEAHQKYFVYNTIVRRLKMGDFNYCGFSNLGKKQKQLMKLKQPKFCMRTYCRWESFIPCG